jgi:hypothetical protein
MVLTGKWRRRLEDGDPSHNPESGDQRNAAPVFRHPDRDRFPCTHLLDFLGAVGTEIVILSLKDQMAQGLLRPKDPAGQDYRYVVMPMRI